VSVKYYFATSLRLSYSCHIFRDRETEMVLGTASGSLSSLCPLEASHLSFPTSSGSKEINDSFFQGELFLSYRSS
jgi:hypothetical protein